MLYGRCFGYAHLIVMRINLSEWTQACALFSPSLTLHLLCMYACMAVVCIYESTHTRTDPHFQKKEKKKIFWSLFALIPKCYVIHNWFIFIGFNTWWNPFYLSYRGRNSIHTFCLLLQFVVLANRIQIYHITQQTECNGIQTISRWIALAATQLSTGNANIIVCANKLI